MHKHKHDRDYPSLMRDFTRHLPILLKLKPARDVIVSRQAIRCPGLLLMTSSSSSSLHRARHRASFRLAKCTLETVPKASAA